MKTAIKLLGVIALAAVIGFSFGSCKQPVGSTNGESSTSVFVTGVTLSQSTLNMPINSTTKLIASVQPESATNKKVNWTSSNTVVATVSTDGKVTTKAEGTTTITVTTEDGGKTATCTVTVEELPPPQVQEGDIKFDPAEIGSGVTKTYGDEIFSITIKEKNGSGAITYSSGNTAIATVAGATGEVTITGAGTTTITAVKAADAQVGEATASYTLIVEQAMLTVRANNFIIDAVDSAPAYTYTITGFHHSETQETATTGDPAIYCSYSKDSGKGSYEIAISKGTLVAQNYTFDFINGTLSAGLVDQATLTITNHGTKTWGDEPFQLDIMGGTGTGEVYFELVGITDVISITSGGQVTIRKSGTAQVKAIKQGDSSYNPAESDPVTITVSKRNLSNVTVTGVGVYTYTGSAIIPDIDVTDTILGIITSSDYTVSYSNNTNAGTADVSITATASGNYTGTKSGNFTITKAAGVAVATPMISGEPGETSLTVSIVTTPDNGQTVEYAISMASNGTSLSAWQDSTTFTDLTTGTTYFVYARSRENDNYLAGETSSASTGITPRVPLESIVGLAAKLTWLQTYAQSNTNYILEINTNESIAPHSLSYSGRSNITITLKGIDANRTINLSSDGSIFTVPSSITLVLDNNITLQGRSNNRSSLVSISNGGTLIMKTGAKISGNTSRYSGGGVSVSGTFIMEGGEISGNTVSDNENYNLNNSVYGGGLYVNGGSFEMTGGKISGNRVSISYTWSSTTATSVSKTSGGGGVYLNGGSFSMTGGEISGNIVSATANKDASAYNGIQSVYAYAYAYGGGVYLNGGSFSMTGGEISGNTVSAFSDDTTSSYGGGVNVRSNGSFTKTGGIITGYANNTSNGNVVREKGNVQADHGHAVYVSSDRRRETSVVPTMNLNSSLTGTAGGWVEATPTYTITYQDVGGETFSGIHEFGYPTTHTYGTATTLVSPTKANYTFEGWFSNVDGTGTALSSLSASGYTDNIILYAKWSNLFTITFNASGGNWNGSTVNKTIQVDWGTAVSPPADPEWEWARATFAGWFTQGKGGQQFNFAMLITSDITLYAQWEHEIEDMVWISAGTFTMGSPESEPGHSDNETQHSVTLTQGFYMGQYPVTQAQYQAVMGSNPSYNFGVGDNYPVYFVKWYDALVFCNKLSIAEGLTPAYSISGSTDPAEWGTVPTSSNSTWNAVTIVSGSTGYRLPTEAQWEYACRAGTTTAYNWGTDYIDDSKANYFASYVDANNTTAGTELSRTIEVGSYEPNVWGLYDMHGNVEEWCWDRYGAYSSGSQTDPTGAVSGINRVLRNGSFSKAGQSTRSAYRHDDTPIRRIASTGFRLVRP